MKERETKTIETPIGKNKIVVKSWISGREKRALSRVFLENVAVGGGTSNTKETLNSADLIERAENLALETLIVSIDDSNEKVVDKILDMKSADYDFIIKEINKITKGSDFLE